jgi:hypothetical protein
MKLLKQPITWIALAVLVLISLIVGCSIGNPEGTRSIMQMFFELLFRVLIWIFAIKLLFFIFGPPRK